MGNLTEGQLFCFELSLCESQSEIHSTVLEWFSLFLKWFSAHFGMIFTRFESRFSLGYSAYIRSSLYSRVTISLFLTVREYGRYSGHCKDTAFPQENALIKRAKTFSRLSGTASHETYVGGQKNSGCVLYIRPIFLYFWVENLLFSLYTGQHWPNSDGVKLTWTFLFNSCNTIFWLTLTGGNWQKWKRVFLICPCHEIYRHEAVGLKSCKNTWKITIFVKMWNLGQYCENLIFCQ